MKIIDEKGRIFGKINIIDFLVILFLLCILPVFYFGYKLLTEKPAVLKGETVVIETNCQFIKVKPELLKLISVGDKGLDESGQVIGEIISLGQSRPYKYEFSLGEGQKVVKEDPILKEMEVKLKLKAGIKDHQIYYKDKLIKIGLPLEFITNKYETIAVPSTVKKKREEEIVVKLKVKFRNIIPEIAENVRPGDSQTQIAKNNGKWIVAKVSRIISNNYAEVITLTQGKNWHIQGHPKYRDLVLEIETLCVRKPEGLFLENRPVKAGKPFEFSPDLYSISGLIIEVEPK